MSRCTSAGFMSVFNAKEEGRATLRTSINKPIPFWPSLEPWAKLTPVHVTIRRPRTQWGGAFSGSAGSKSPGVFKNFRKAKRMSAATPKPTIGEISRDKRTWPA